MNMEENINLQEAKKSFRFKDIPKKYVGIGVSILVIIIFVSIVVGGQEKLSGSYIDSYNNRYDFQITDSRQGEYGGILNEYDSSGELDGSHVWFLEDNTIYINGKQTYRYNGKYIFSLKPTTGITVEEGNVISGHDSYWEDQKSGGILFTNLFLTTVSFLKMDTLFLKLFTGHTK